MTSDNVEWLAGRENADGSPTEVVRLEREVERLKAQFDAAEVEIDTLKAEDPAKYAWMHACDDLAKECEELKAQLDAAGDGDTWREAAKRVEGELEATREQLRQQTKSFCTHCGKLFPKGKEGVAQFREHIAECNKHPLHPMAADNYTLRGLLREACIGYEHNYDDASSDKRLRRVPIFHAWYERAQAALEGKP